MPSQKYHRRLSPTGSCYPYPASTIGSQQRTVEQASANSHQRVSSWYTLGSYGQLVEDNSTTSPAVASNKSSNSPHYSSSDHHSQSTTGSSVRSSSAQSSFDRIFSDNNPGNASENLESSFTANTDITSEEMSSNFENMDPTSLHAVNIVLDGNRPQIFEGYLLGIGAQFDSQQYR